MLFSSIPFLYYFLPAVMLLYCLARGPWKNGVLLLGSLFFYAWGEPRYVLLMLASILLGYGHGLLIGRYRGKRLGKIFLGSSVISSLLILGLFKYADFFIVSFNQVFGLGMPLLRISLPIGISFYTFQILSYTIDVYRGTEAQKNLLHFAAYVSLFPQLIAGPIVRYTDVERDLQSREHSLEKVAEGSARFLVGLGKKVLIADRLAELVSAFRASAEPSVLLYWLYALAFTLEIYFDFSGYSDMGIGLGRIFGFTFPENFNYPYISKSITEFWRRWHMSLGSWFRDYVYIPLGGNRVGRLRWYLNIFVVWALTGLWHGADWNFVLWGLLYAVLLVNEKLWLKKQLERMPAVFQHAYVLFFVILGFVLFNGNGLSGTVEDLRGLFGGGYPLWNGESLYRLRSYGPLLLFSILGASPLPKALYRKFGEKIGKSMDFLEALLGACLLLSVTAFLVDGSFSPFLYFRF